MIISNVKIVTLNEVIDNGHVIVEGDKIAEVNNFPYKGKEDFYDAKGLTLMPGFIDVHIHGSKGIDFMDAKASQYKEICESLYKEGVTTFLATTLTSDNASLKYVCEQVKIAKKDNPSLLGIHFEGPYISEKYKGAQNPEFIRNPNIEEFDELNKISGGNVRYISMAPEKDGAMEFIAHLAKEGVTISAGHSDATFNQIEEAIKVGLTNCTHTHNAMSGHHHRNPGIVTAAFYFDELYTECICDRIHVCDDALKTFYKIVGEDRFIMITDALKAKNSELETFKLFGLDCVRKNGAAYLLSGPLAGSLLTMDQGLRNMKEVANLSLVELAKISSYNAAKSLHLSDRGEISKNKLADFVLLDDSLHVKEVYKLGKKVI